MRRLLPIALLALAPFTSVSAAGGAGTCVATGGSTVCPSAVMTCSGNNTIRVTVYGPGSGTASCGDATASCFSIRTTCTDDAHTTVGGPLRCSSTGAGVAVCAVVIAATR